MISRESPMLFTVLISEHLDNFWKFRLTWKYSTELCFIFCISKSCVLLQQVVCVLMALKSACGWGNFQRIEAVCLWGIFPPLPSCGVSMVGSTIVIKTWCFSFTDFDFRPWLFIFSHYLTNFYFKCIYGKNWCWWVLVEFDNRNMSKIFAEFQTVVSYMQ